MVWLGKDSCRSTAQNKNKNSPTDQRSYTACSERGSDKFFGNHIKYAFSEASFPMESLGLLK